MATDALTANAMSDADTAVEAVYAPMAAGRTSPVRNAADTIARTAPGVFIRTLDRIVER